MVTLICKFDYINVRRAAKVREATERGSAAVGSEAGMVQRLKLRYDKPP
jgi:hypothetical protein